MRSVRWPPDRFYWSVLASPGFSRIGELPPGLHAAFEEDVPVPLESLHAVCAPIGDGQILVCAAPRADLASLELDLRSVTPESLPGLGVVDPLVLNLLVGAFEPRAVKTARIRRHLLAMTTVALCAALAVAGLLRRAGALRNLAEEATQGLGSILESALPAGPPGALVLEIERARRESAAVIEPPADAALALASILSVWPTQVPSIPQSLQVGGDRASISVTLEGEPTTFLRALAAPTGWALEEPRVGRAGSFTRVQLQMRRGGIP